MHAEGLHAGRDILDELDARFDCQAVAYGPYFFADLTGTSDTDEQAAIDSGLIQAKPHPVRGPTETPSASALSVTGAFPYRPADH